MKQFSILYKSFLSSADVENRKALMMHYLGNAEDRDKISAIKLLTTEYLPKLLGSKSLIKMVVKEKNVPDWLMEASHQATSDWTEACSLLVADPNIEASDFKLSDLVLELKSLDSDKEQYILNVWKSLSITEIWVFNKMITGTLKPIFTTKNIAEIMGQKFGANQDLVLLRMVLNRDMDFAALLQNKRQEVELDFLPYEFIIPSEWIINFNHENPADYVLEPFVFGDRIYLVKNDQRVLLYNKMGVWQQPNDGDWQHLVPASSKVEYIAQDEKIFIIKVIEWSDQVALDQNLARFNIDKWIVENNLKEKIALIPQSSISQWNHLNTQDDQILKHKYLPDKWYRIKPKPPELVAILWYAEMNTNSNSMKFEFVLAIENADLALISIARISSETLSETEQTRLYYWIQNNTLKKTGPVRTVRPGQYFKISYDRVVENKRLKAKLKLINVKILKWLDSNQSISVSKWSEITFLRQD